jgi:hypothetical protein
MQPKGQTSHHLTQARQLLDELEAERNVKDQRTRATAAVAHAILVLAEQVAVARVVMAADAVNARGIRDSDVRGGAA